MTLAAYYNETDGFCCDWLSNLMDAGHIMAGRIDDRSVVDVPPEDLRGYERVHLFAGIAGWELALNLAGWRGPVWTGSCPCQPLSSAGQRKGHADERHLWPAFYRLVAERAPAVVFGEQVASKDGREWFAAVRADLERVGYACGAADLPAAGVGAPHVRQRLWWVADSDGRHAGAEGLQRGGEHGLKPEDGRADLRVDIALGARLEGHAGDGERGRESRRLDPQADGPVAATGAWGDLEWLPCADGKTRPTQPGLFPLAHGIPGRVGRLRAYGNAIFPQVAAAFVGAAAETMTERPA